MALEREKEINRRRHRREKIRKLRAKLAAATTAAERERIAKKIKAISPDAPLQTGK